MRFIRVLLTSQVLAIAGAAAAQHAGHGASSASPYAGEQTREIKALSAQEQRAWAEGQGMGLARAAELNGYPGPMHVLELAGQLHLTDSQIASTRELMSAHKAEVRGLGTKLIQAERELDVLFREKRATGAEIQQRTEAISKLQAQNPCVSPADPPKQTELLSAVQVDRYNTLRGYQ